MQNTDKAKLGMAQPVTVVEADVFDRMTETRELIAQRAYEIYQARGCRHGSDQDDWFTAEGELLSKVSVEYEVTERAEQVSVQLPGFDAKDLEVEVGHRRAVICGVHSDSNPSADGHHGNPKKIMRIIEFPCDVDPTLARATLQ